MAPTYKRADRERNDIVKRFSLGLASFVPFQFHSHSETSFEVGGGCDSHVVVFLSAGRHFNTSPSQPVSQQHSRGLTKEF